MKCTCKPPIHSFFPHQLYCNLIEWFSSHKLKKKNLWKFKWKLAVFKYLLILPDYFIGKSCTRHQGFAYLQAQFYFSILIFRWQVYAWITEVLFNNSQWQGRAEMIKFRLPCQHYETSTASFHLQLFRNNTFHQIFLGNLNNSSDLMILTIWYRLCF